MVYEALMLVSVPAKTTERYELGKTIRAVVAKECSLEASASQGVVQAANFMDDRRNAACLAVLAGQVRYGGPGRPALVSNINYVKLLSYVGAKAGPKCLPSGRTDGVERILWNDAFGGQPSRTSEYKLDIIACSINCANITASLAIRKAYEVPLGPDELKSAAKEFQKAAGFYEYIMTKMPYVIADGSADLHAPCHTACKFAMLANAQALLFRSVMDSKNNYPPMMKARVAAGVCELYEIVVKHCEDAGMKDTPMAARLVPPAKILARYFDALAELGMAAICEHAAIHEAADGMYGESIARTRRACNYLYFCREMLPHLTPNSNEARYFPDVINAELSKAAGRLAAAEKGNENFFQAEPSDVASVKPRVIVSAADQSGVFTDALPADHLTQIKPLIDLASS